MRHERRVARGRDEQQMNRLLEHRASARCGRTRRPRRNAVFERAEGIALGVEIAAQVRLPALPDWLLISSARLATSTPRRQIAERRQFARKVPVDEDQLTGCAGKPPRLESACCRAALRRSARAETASCAMAETFVKRQSSSCVVGKPTSQKRAKALRAASAATPGRGRGRSSRSR